MTSFPLKVGPTGRYLVDQNGTPFLGLGESPWEMATTLNATDQATFLADRKARGFNMLLVQCIDNIFNANGTGQNTNGDMPFTTKQGGGSYTNSTTQSPDFSTPNSSYWTYIDATLNRIAAQGFLILLYPAWIGNPIGDPSSEGYYNALNAQSSGIRQGYGTFLANRYGPGGSNHITGLIWGIGGDNNPAVTAVNSDIVTGIQSADTSHLFYVDGLDGSSMINLWGGSSWFGCNGIYSDQVIGHPWAYAQCKSEYQNTTGLQTSYPQFWKEGAYEFGQAGWTEQIIRSQTWQSMLGGCWGYCLGIDGVWQFSTGWQSKLGSVATVCHQVVNTFFSQRHWELLVPDWGNAFLTNGGSYANATFASAARASDASWGAIYSPTSETLTVDMSGFRSRVMCSWMDPTTGKYTGAGNFANSSTQSFSSPATNANGDTDFVLVFETQPSALSRWAVPNSASVVR